jgi:hypothetical protein
VQNAYTNIANALQVTLDDRTTQPYNKLSERIVSDLDTIRQAQKDITLDQHTNIRLHALRDISTEITRRLKERGVQSVEQVK